MTCNVVIQLVTLMMSQIPYFRNKGVCLSVQSVHNRVQLVFQCHNVAAPTNWYSGGPIRQLECSRMCSYQQVLQLKISLEQPRRVNQFTSMQSIGIMHILQWCNICKLISVWELTNAIEC